MLFYYYVKVDNLLRITQRPRLRLGPAVAQADGAVEDQTARPRVGVEAEIALALELDRLAR